MDFTWFAPGAQNCKKWDHREVVGGPLESLAKLSAQKVARFASRRSAVSIANHLSVDVSNGIASCWHRSVKTSIANG